MRRATKTLIIMAMESFDVCNWILPNSGKQLQAHEQLEVAIYLWDSDPCIDFAIVLNVAVT